MAWFRTTKVCPAMWEALGGYLPVRGLQCPAALARRSPGWEADCCVRMVHLAQHFRQPRDRVPPRAKNGLWVVVSPSVIPTPILESGSAAPGLSNGELVSEFSPIQSVALSPAPSAIIVASGLLQLFQSGVDTTNNVVVWAGPPLNLRVVARTGQPVPPQLSAGCFAALAKSPSTLPARSRSSLGAHRTLLLATEFSPVQ